MAQRMESTSDVMFRLIGEVDSGHARVPFSMAVHRCWMRTGCEVAQAVLALDGNTGMEGAAYLV